MITEEQRRRLCGWRCYQDDVFVILTRDFKPTHLPYILPKGTIINLSVFTSATGILYIGDKLVESAFPYDAAELLE